MKRRRKNVAVTASSAAETSQRKTTAAELQKSAAASESAAPAAPLGQTNDATKQSNWYDEGLDEKGLLGTTRAKPGTTAENAAADGTYKGTSNYQSFIQKNPNTFFYRHTAPHEQQVCWQGCLG